MSADTPEAGTPLTRGQRPLFPLQTVLFPGGWMPLRIFEVRYLDMINRCHKAGAPFGVVCLSEGSEVRRIDPKGPPTGDAFAQEVFFPVGTLASIERLERPQPGLLVIHCRGLQRFQIDASHKLRHGLWVADVTRQADDSVVPVPEDLTSTRDALVRLLERCDAFRRPDRFAQALLACECDARGRLGYEDGAYPQRPRLLATLEGARSVNTQAVVDGMALRAGGDAPGGPQIAQAIHTARVKAVEHAMGPAASA